MHRFEGVHDAINLALLNFWTGGTGFGFGKILSHSCCVIWVILLLLRQFLGECLHVFVKLREAGVSHLMAPET